MTRAVLRYVTHQITQHPDTDVTFEAECLHCEWTARPSEDGAAVDIECMGHTGRSGHKGFRRLCTSFAMVVRTDSDERTDSLSGEVCPHEDTGGGV
ncbi:DUF7848 domain-containing protein [Streptomyces phaeochromogenes]|uniref:DUF7848 domain-containing protein n=1 Tax=Streptomyces phaeochromogenes TaxID=1923 RepID=UPI0036CACA40